MWRSGTNLTDQTANRCCNGRQPAARQRLPWHSLATRAYFLKDRGCNYLVHLLRTVNVAPFSLSDAQRAFSLPMVDLEDALQAAAALGWRADYIVTRNVRDYNRSPVTAVTPTAFLLRVS